MIIIVLDTPGKLGKMIIGMNKALGEIPVTVKLRTGSRMVETPRTSLCRASVLNGGVGAVTVCKLDYNLLIVVDVV